MGKAIRFLNLLGYIIMITVNILANTLPINGVTTGEISDEINALFTPSGITFAIWGIIYVLLLCFVIYQLIPKERFNPYVNKIGISFFLSCLLNASWILAWHYERIFLSVIIMILLLITLITIYQTLDIGNCELKKSTKWCINIPFSVYLAWIGVATIANISAALKYYGWQGLGIPEVIWTVIVIILALIIALYKSIKNNDLAFMLTFIWAFSGLLLRYWGKNTLLSITVLSCLIILWLQLFGRFREFLCLDD